MITYDDIKTDTTVCVTVQLHLHVLVKMKMLTIIAFWHSKSCTFLTIRTKKK